MKFKHYFLFFGPDPFCFIQFMKNGILTYNNTSSISTEAI